MIKNADFCRFRRRHGGRTRVKVDLKDAMGKPGKAAP